MFKFPVTQIQANDVHHARPDRLESYRFGGPLFLGLNEMIQRASDDLLWSQIVARAWCDDAVMRRLQSDPRAVLAEHSLDVPGDTVVKVLEGSEAMVLETSLGERHFILPAKPPEVFTEDEFDGGAVSWCGCAACGACRASGACGACGACGCRGCR